MSFVHAYRLAVLISLLAIPSTAFSATDQQAIPTSARVIELDTLEGGVVPFDYEITDGFYATITAMTSFKKPKIEDEKKIKLKNVTGFKKDIEVRALIGDKPAPLVVIFLGLTSKSKDPLARLWQSQLWEAGYHVLVFDSVFRPSFNQRSCHGVAGNLEMEAWLGANIIDAFLQHSDVRDKVTKIGLLGASYGGSLALNFAKLACDGRVKVKPDRVLVFSPPVSMRVSAALLDRYYDEDRANHGLLEMWKMQGHEPVERGKPIPFSGSLMRAGIGYVFHEDLEDAIACSKDMYNYELPPAAKSKDGKKNDKDSRAFTRFIEQVVYPYWHKHSGVLNVDDLWDRGDLYKLLKACPAEMVHAVVTEDDPLNDYKLVKMLQRDVDPAKLTILPRGGHLGFVGCKWSKERVLQIFR